VGAINAASAVPRAVLDTNVLYSHVRRVALVELVRLGRFEAIWSSWIVAELNRVLTWQWAERHGLGAETQRRASAESKEMMTHLLAAFTLVDPPFPHPAPWPALTDLWDIPIYATAVAADAGYVVTDNLRHAPPVVDSGQRAWNGVEYLSYRAFLDHFT